MKSESTPQSITGPRLFKEGDITLDVRCYSQSARYFPLQRSSI
jgi:hypothetical protein